MADAGLTGDAAADGGPAATGSSGGCSCTESRETTSGWTGLGGLSLGLFALVGRRRKQAR
jgi:MYXO-CTERM domain-containing protein